MCSFLYRKLEIIKQSIHIGEILHEAVKKTGRNIDVITHKAGYKRGTFYSHIKQSDLSLAILRKYARAIDHDFSTEVPGYSDFVFEEEDANYKLEPTTIEDALKQRDDWKEKYYTLLEKYLGYVEKDKGSK